MNQLIAIDGIQIHQDKEEHYSLNDLHKAAGGEHKHQPHYWLQLQQTKELIEAISNSRDSGNYSPVSSSSGRYGGTYVCKELVYAYAMWINATFHLKVIRTFDAVVTGQYQRKAAISEAAKLFTPVFRIARLIGCTKNAAAISANQAVFAETNVNLLSLLGQTHLIAANQKEQYYTPTELGKMCGQTPQQVNRLLEQDGLQTKIAGKWEPTEKGRAHCVILDTGKKHSSGVPVTQIKWAPSVMQAYMTTEAA